MVTKEMVLAGFENNIVHVGAYTEGGVTQDLQESTDELACSIGYYSFFFSSGDEYASIQLRTARIPRPQRHQNVGRGGIATYFDENEPS